jgi:hypothetical protein
MSAKKKSRAKARRPPSARHAANHSTLKAVGRVAPRGHESPQEGLMSTDNVTPMHPAAIAAPAADELHKMLDEAFYDLGRAIAIVKVIDRAAEAEDEGGAGGQAMGVAIEKLDAVYKAMDQLILRIAHEGVRPWLTP